MKIDKDSNMSMGEQRKPRLLIPISFNLSIRYLLRTGLIKKILEFSQPIMLLAWNDPELSQELIALGAEVFLLPNTRIGTEYSRIRETINTWYFYRRLRSSTTHIREKRANLDRSLKKIAVLAGKRFAQMLILSIPGSIKRLLVAEHALAINNTNFAEYQDLLRQVKPDAVFSVTPYLREEELILKAAYINQLPLFASILSFDNMTTRGWIPVLFQHYMVWNHYNQAEILRAYPQIKPDQVSVVGPAQFDFYGNKNYILEESVWRQQMSLPIDRPVILYGANAKTHFPNEPVLVRQLDAAIESGEIPGKPIILLRSHPVDSRDRWQTVLAHAKNIVFDNGFSPSGNYDKEFTLNPKYCNINDHDVAILTSTLKHSLVHINVCSTMALDGAMFDRPQIAPAYDPIPGSRYNHSIRELYDAEHYIPIVRSGGIELVQNHAELVRAVTSALQNPRLRTIEREHMLNDVISYTDGRCTDRVVSLLRQFLTQENK